MALYLVELTPQDASKENATALIEDAGQALQQTEAELIETQVTSDFKTIYVIVESNNPGVFANAFKTAFDGKASLAGPDEVRLVGADLDDIKKLKSNAEYLIEWDIPAEITMDQYLARKKANSPNYAKVPEVSFLRTYVREDTAKCLCFYDAPDEDALRRAREAVNTPIDRIFKLNEA
ncbi:alpha-helical coiled-coil protein [Mycobacteroides abscessus subsp. abscessus]|nr:alpha-helical coiled-coil protein [Mycobacteroides abscessus subsp. abscessus]